MCVFELMLSMLMWPYYLIWWSGEFVWAKVVSFILLGNLHEIEVDLEGIGGGGKVYLEVRCSSLLFFYEHLVKKIFLVFVRGYFWCARFLLISVIIYSDQQSLYHTDFHCFGLDSGLLLYKMTSKNLSILSQLNLQNQV